jgi:hypothetical protein
MPYLLPLLAISLFCFHDFHFFHYAIAITPPFFHWLIRCPLRHTLASLRHGCSIAAISQIF